MSDKESLKIGDKVYFGIGCVGPKYGYIEHICEKADKVVVVMEGFGSVYDIYEVSEVFKNVKDAVKYAIRKADEHIKVLEINKRLLRYDGE